MFVNFFIKRPIFAAVISLIIVLVGAVCIPLLPISQYPQIAPPTIQVLATYTGASAEVVEKSVTTPLEEQINGVEGAMYINSSSDSSGTSKIIITFDVDYDLNIANVDVQNRVNIAMPQLPDEVKQVGVTTKKQMTNMTLAINLISPNRTFDDLYLSNYADINIVDVLKRLPGVGDVQILGEKKYSMRLWLDPNKLTSMGITSNDIIAAVQEQNIQVAAGSIGEPPSSKTQPFTYTVKTLGRLSTVTQFENIIIRTNKDGSVVCLKDVAKITLGSEKYQWYANLDGATSAVVAVFQLPEANALQVSDEVKKKIEELKKRFPKDMDYIISYNTTDFVKQSLDEVVYTLFEAILLVFLVVFIFLQDWRSTLIPLITIPVSLIGTFGLLMAFGFSINTLSLFGLVLAIGIVVDDSIVVVENVSRNIEQNNMKPFAATIIAMGEVVGPVIATTLVLMAVFVPVAFMPGITGRLYKQFALTIAFSVGISAINALSLSPALCALILRPKKKKEFFLFKKFNQGFNWVLKIYESIVKWLIKKWFIILIFFLITLGLTYYLFKIVPTGFVPSEDQGHFFVSVQGPEGASLDRTREISNKIEKIILKIPGVNDLLTIGGYDLIGGMLNTNTSTMIPILKPWDKRTTKALSLDSIIDEVYARTKNIAEAEVMAYAPPPIQGLSTTGGFQFEVQDYSSGDIENLSQVVNELIKKSKTKKELSHLYTSFAVNYPQYYIDLDRKKAKSLNISISEIFNTLQAYLGSMYINDFNKFGRIYRVYVQAQSDARSSKSDISKLYVRSNDGKNSMIPLSNVVKVHEIRGPQYINHYNLFRAVSVYGSPAEGYSSGQAIQAMEELADEVLPDGYGYEWTGTAYQEKEAGSLAGFIYLLALAFVFLVLAAQYESWSMPFMILLSVPLAILGALSAQWLRGLNNDVYCQIGLVLLVGLASKNAILIVEFAKQLHEKGMDPFEAAVKAATLRLRPILMTAFAFILGVLPLVIAQGAGAASRHSLGTAVFGGMIASTFLSILIVPVFYYVIEKLREGSSKKKVRV